MREKLSTKIIKYLEPYEGERREPRTSECTSSKVPVLRLLTRLGCFPSLLDSHSWGWWIQRVIRYEDFEGKDDQGISATIEEY